MIRKENTEAVEIYLVRHGETESNRERRYQGWTESPLSELGLRQAEKVGHYLSARGVDELFCSDLKRALHTARVIGSGCGMKPLVTPLLREINFGQWEGLTFEEIERSWGSEISRWLDDPFHESAPGGETLKEVCARMSAFFEQLVERSTADRRIVAVSHGGSIRALLYSVLNLDRASFFDLKIDNASISLIRKAGDRFIVDYYNRVHHLEVGTEREVDPDGL
jgi:alpha-ribazole phosphatase